MSAVTARDVAIAAGVSQATVSRALRPGSRVAPSTRERVLAAADQLGYVPNSMAQGLATARTRTIAVVVADLTNPFYPHLLHPLHDALDRAGYRVVLFAERTDMGSGREHLSQLLDRSLDGVLLTTATLDFDAAELVRRHVPFVLLIRSVDRVAADVVVSDNVDGARQAAKILIDAGHRRIGMISGPANTSTARDRMRGFREALAEAGCPLDETLVRTGSYSHQSGHQRTRELLALTPAPTAIFCGNDVVAFGALDAARRLGVDVPGELSVVGFDDIPMAEWLAFGLTTVRQPFVDMAHTAARMLVERIERGRRNGESLPARHEVFPVNVVHRATLGPAPRDVSSSGPRPAPRSRSGHRARGA
jgi:LacI family transcriptional regulator